MTITNLTSNDSAVAFGMWLFLAIIAVAVLSYAMLLPFMSAGDDAFDDTYRDAYLTTEGKSTATFLTSMFNFGAFIFVLLFASVMVINRAIYRSRE